MIFDQMPAAMMLFEVALVLFGAIQMALCDREHKVHNIVLYPDRHSWCKTTAIKQEVASPGFESITIENNVCVGACYSYSIPKTQPAEPGELITPYCDSCQPAGTQCYHVTLRSDGKTQEGPRTIQKRVEIITACTCMSCDTIQKKDCELSNENTPELPSDLYEMLHPRVDFKTILETKQFTLEEIPDFLNFAPPKNVSNLDFDMNNPNMTHEQKYQLNIKLINLLRSIQNEGEDSPNFSYDKNQLKDLLKIIEGSEQKLSDKNLLEFINFVNINNSEDLELDLSKLKEVLETFRKDEDLVERHRNFGLGLEQTLQNNAKINQDLEKLPKNFGLEGSHHMLGSAKGSHIAMGLHPNSLQDDDEVKTVIGHHHLGESQHVGLDMGHLIRGPHGSLAFSPDVKVEEKLNIVADLVKPNQEGVIVSYENHPKTSIIN